MPSEGWDASTQPCATADKQEFLRRQMEKKQGRRLVVE
jgi:hypothetical protein